MHLNYVEGGILNKTNLLKRKRVDDILSVIYNYPLTIVEAPIGFGKTTAVRNFLESHKNPYFWITFLNSNETNSFFWNDFSFELSKIDKEAGKKLKCLGFPVDIPQISKVLSILNNIDYTEKTVLVIDDYHLCQKIQVNNFIRRIILEEIDNLHIVIITRDTTTLNFAELFSKGLCQIISQQQLKFTSEEIRAYCLMLNKNISESNLIKIIEYTDGWISLVYMILLGLKMDIPVGMNNTIEDLIENALFNTYDKCTQNFLLKISIMENFTEKQALFVTQEEKTNTILKILLKKNAFIFYDEINKTYKIHNVLLDFLRIKQHFSHKEIQGLYRRLGEWYLRKKEFIIAYGYLNRAGDVEKILSDFNNPDNVRNELTEFEGSFEMFNSIPEELLYKYPIAYLQHILLSILNGNEEIIEDYIQRLDKLQNFYIEIKDIDNDYRKRIIAEILIMKKFTVFNDIEKMSKNDHKIIDLLSGRQSYIMLRENEFTFGSPHLLYAYFREQGSLKKVLHTVTDNLPLYSKIANGCGTGCEYVGLAEYAFETGNFKDAELNSFRAIYKAKTKEQVSLIICAAFNLMRLYVFQGKIDESIKILTKLNNKVNHLNNPIYNTTMDLCKGYIYGCIGEPEKIPYWLQIGDMTSADFFYQGMAFNYIVYGKAVMLSRNYIKLEMLSESFIEYFSMFSNQLGFIHNGIFKAVAKYHICGIEEGISVLEETLFKAKTDDIVMPFVENATYIMTILETISNNNLKDKYINKVTALSREYVEKFKDIHKNKIKLSQREIEILSFIANGLKRNEIACRLNISQSTVKTHLQNIYKKLQVSGKFEAIKIGQMYGII